MVIAPCGEAQRSGTSVIEQLDIAFREGHGLIAERDFDLLFELRDQKFRPMGRHWRKSRALADLVGTHRVFEDAVGCDAGISSIAVAGILKVIDGAKYGLLKAPFGHTQTRRGSASVGLLHGASITYDVASRLRMCFLRAGWQTIFGGGFIYQAPFRPQKFLKPA